MIGAAVLPFPWINRITWPLRFSRPATTSSIVSLVVLISRSAPNAVELSVMLT